MNLVLTMAGLYSRFRLFGNKIPKYLLPLGAKTVLSTIISSYSEVLPTRKIYLIANRSDQIFFPILKSTLQEYDLPVENLIYINQTASQLETALHALEVIPESEQDSPIAFASIDTVLYDRKDFFGKLESCIPMSSILDTFDSENSQYSYARIGSDGCVLDVVDQNVISNSACSGLYGFGSLLFMSQVAGELLRDHNAANFTRLYRAYLDKGLSVQATEMEGGGQTIVLGTPDEYLVNIHRF